MLLVALDTKQPFERLSKNGHCDRGQIRAAKLMITIIERRQMKMKPQAFAITPNEYPPALNVVGEKITVLASNSAIQGNEIFLQQGDEGTGPAPHSHDWDESFYVTKGNAEISYDDKTIIATPGTLIHLPAGTIHGFRFGAGGGEMISITGQAGHAERLFTSISQEIPAGIPNLRKLFAVAHKCGVTVVT
jgi:quercetin dioxygenase-like cupin family protein